MVAESPAPYLARLLPHRDAMDTNTLLLIIVVILLLGGGGFSSGAVDQFGKQAEGRLTPASLSCHGLACDVPARFGRRAAEVNNSRPCSQ